MTTSRNNTIMSWMAYTDFLSRLRIAAGILLPLNTRTLLLYPGGRDCIGTAGVDAYSLVAAGAFRQTCCLPVMFISQYEEGNDGGSDDQNDFCDSDRGWEADWGLAIKLVQDIGNNIDAWNC